MMSRQEYNFKDYDSFYDYYLKTRKENGENQSMKFIANLVNSNLDKIFKTVYSFSDRYPQEDCKDYLKDEYFEIETAIFKDFDKGFYGRIKRLKLNKRDFISFRVIDTNYYEFVFRRGDLRLDQNSETGRMLEKMMKQFAYNNNREAQLSR